VEQYLKEKNASLKLQNALLRTEIAKWKRAHYYANKDLARMELQEGKRIDDANESQQKF
jgi:hypothetical protein